MADEVMHVVNSGVLVSSINGVATINNNTLKIPGTQASRTVFPTNRLQAISDVAWSGQLVNRFDDPTYYTA